MKVSVNTKLLKQAANKAAASTRDKSPKPILSCLKLTAADGKLKLLGCNLEVWVEVECECDVLQGGSVVVSAARFSSWLNLTPSDAVHIEATERGVTLRGDRSSIIMPTEPPGEFPGVPDVTGYEWELPARALAAGMRTRLACGPDYKGWSLGGLSLEVRDGQRMAVATDGKCLVVQQLGETDSQDHRILIPSAAAAMLLKIIPEDGTACLADNGNVVSVAAAGIRFYARLLEGRFPEWKRHLPNKSPAGQCTLIASQFGNAVRAAAITTDENSVGVDFALTDGDLSLSSRAQGAGESAVSLPVPSTGASKVSLDPKYIMHLLSNIAGEASIEMVLLGEDDPVRFVAPDGFWGIIYQLSPGR